MKTKYIEILDLVLSNPANQLSKSSRDMLDTMKNGLKIEKEDHSEEMISMLEKSRKMLQSLKLSMLVHPDCEEGSEFDDYTTSAQETEDEIEELLHKVKHNEK